MKKLFLLAAVVGIGWAAWQRWQSLQAEKSLAWASATDTLD